MEIFIVKLVIERFAVADMRVSSLEIIKDHAFIPNLKFNMSFYVNGLYARRQNMTITKTTSIL